MGQALEVSLTIGFTPPAYPFMSPHMHSGLHSPADTEWVRDLIEMGGASEELSIMSPERRGWGLRHQTLGVRGRKAWPLPLLPQENKYTLGSITKDISLPENVLP